MFLLVKWQKPYLQVQVTKPMVIFYPGEVNRMHAHIVRASSHSHITFTQTLRARMPTCTTFPHVCFGHANSHPHIALSHDRHLGDVSVAQLRTIHAWPNQAKMSQGLVLEQSLAGEDLCPWDADVQA